jgi:branched-chain amino acid transport system substrate-binding protein
MQKPLTTLAFGLAIAFGPGVPYAAAATIAVVAPKSGPYTLLGEQVLQGARAAAKANGDTLVEIDEPCSEQGGAAAAEAIRQAGASAAIGFLCVETLATALPALAQDSIPAITISVRSRILMEDALRNGWPLFRMAPAENVEADRIAEIIADRWKAEAIAFVDDGTIYGRELLASVRRTLEPIGISPVFTDTLRPGQEQQITLVRRLQNAGATHVLIGAERNDVAIIARDAAAENIPLTVLGGDVMRAADRPVELADGALAVALPSYAALPSASPVASALQAGGVVPEGNVLPAYAAMQVAHAASGAGPDGAQTLRALRQQRFQTVIGEIGFGAEGELSENPYRLLEWRGSDFSPAP